MKLVEQLPDLAHLWVRYSYRPWPGSGSLWIDLSQRSLGRSLPLSGSLEMLGSGERLDDVLYLPPVNEDLAEERRGLVDSLQAGGTPLLVQHLVGEKPLVAGSAAVYDLLEVLLRGNLEALASVPEGSTAVWPLVGGYTDRPDLWHEGVDRLAAAGVACVQGLVAELSPGERRRIVEVAGEFGFEALFHGPPPSERDFSKAVLAAGLEPLSVRPIVSGPRALEGNRRLAALLATIGELWLRLERGEARGEAYFRAARWMDRERHDLWALAREGNLSVVNWLDEWSRSALEEFVIGGASSVLDELRHEYLGSTRRSPEG